MKSNSVTSKTATGLLLIALVGQVSALKVVKQPVAIVPTDVNPPPPPPPPALSYLDQPESAVFQREQLQQQRHIELLHQQQREAELQIRQEQLAADREAARLSQNNFMYQQQQQQRHEFAGGVKGAPAPQPQLPPLAYEQYQPPRPAIAYLVVRPPYQLPMAYEPSAQYGRYQQPALVRPFGYPAEYSRPSQPEPSYAAGTKGGRQEDLPPPPPHQQQPLPPPPPQPALVVPVQGDKHGKLRAMLDKIISKLSFSSYEVAGEEYIQPAPCASCQLKQEPQPIQQQQIQQIRDEEELSQLQQQPIQQQQQQQIEQDKDQGFDEPPKLAPQKTAEPSKQEQTKLDEFSQQQQQTQLPSQEQEPEFSRQPQAPIKGPAQPPTRQPEPVQQQRLEEANNAKGAKRYPQQQLYFSQQQQQQQQEPLRQEQKGGF